jgi:hypothetical protein
MQLLPTHRNLGKGHAPCRSHLPAALRHNTSLLLLLRLLLWLGLLQLREASWVLLLLLLSVLGRRPRHNRSCMVLTCCTDAAAPAGVGRAEMVVGESMCD